jgi:gliding motility-associated-like protein
MKPICLLVTFVLFFTHALRAQAPYLAWQKCFGGPYCDDGESITPTSDGGYIMTGFTYGPGGDVSGYHGNTEVGDYWVFKINSTGTIQWQVCLGGTDFDGGSVVLQTSDGGYLVGGQSNTPPGNGNVTSANHGGTDFWVVKLSGTGAIQWQNSYGGELNEYLYAMQPTPDGGYILAGSTQSVGGQVSGNHGGQDYWVVKINGTGTLQWQKCLGGSSDDFAYGVAVCADGTIIVDGYTTSSDGNVTGYHGAEDMWVVKLDANGNLLWQHCLGGSQQDVGWAVVATPDGGCVAAGYTQSADGDVVGNHGVGDMWAVSLSSSTGAIRWQGCYGGSSNEFAYNMAATADGGYLLVGSTNSNDGEVTCYNPESYQMGWVIKINGSGILQWEETLGGDYHDEEHSVQPTADGGAIVGGYTGSPDLPSYHADVSNVIGDFYVAKLTPLPTATINSPAGTLCSGSSFTFTVTTSPTAPASTIYKWMVNGNPVAGGTSYTAAGLVNGDLVSCQLILTLVNNCNDDDFANSNTVTVAVSGVQTPAISISDGGGPVCQGSTATFTASVANGGGVPVYQWQVNGSPAGGSSAVFSSTTLNNGDLVTCDYSDNTNCVVPPSNTVTLQVLPVVIPSISISTPATAVCSGSAVNFTATVAGGGTAPGYQWTLGSQPVGGDGPEFGSSTLTDGAIISCVLTSNASCATPAAVVSNPIPISVSQVLTSSVSIGYLPLTVCSGQPVIFTATAADAGVSPAYQWQVNGSPAGSNSPTFTSSMLTAGDVVSCTLSNTVGCVTPSTASVNPVVNPVPLVGTAPAIILSKGQSTTLELPVTGDVANYTWTPALALSDPDVADPVATPVSTTTYTLTVLSPAGCADSGQLQVKIFSSLAIPGAFSPNGDGHNDIFYVIGGPIGSKVKEFAVFDRWGQRVFQAHDTASDDPAFGWNGNIGGQPAPMGAYVYEIVIGFADGTQQLYKGTVMLVR